MLNRRILRIKAMQSLYAFKQAEESDIQLAINKLQDFYTDYLYTVGLQEKNRVDMEMKRAMAFFSENCTNIRNYRPQKTEPDSPELKATEMLIYLRDMVNKDLQHFKQKMIEETERLNLFYIKALNLILQLADTILLEKNRRDQSQLLEPFDTRMLKFAQHPFIRLLRTDPQFIELSQKSLLSWDEADVANWYRILKSNEKFQNYLAGDIPPEDPEIIKDVVRDLIFLNEKFFRIFEENDLFWTENRSVVRSLVLKTVKEAFENGYSKIKLFSLSRNWEDDKMFFIQLYDLYAKEEAENEKLVTSRLQKWDSERVALLDKIILLLAITEIRNSPSIPIKVSINEYLEIAKSYSTPKSAQFIHGVLDSVVSDLQKNGMIRKSGRGLLDNRTV